MGIIYKILSNEIIEALGWTLIHSLWQGALVAILLGVIMLITNRFTSSTRYFLAVVASLFMLIYPVYTFIKNYNPKQNPVETAFVSRSVEQFSTYESQIARKNINSSTTEGQNFKLKV